MTTGQNYFNATARSLLGYREFGGLVDYMRELAADVHGTVYNRDGAFALQLTLAADTGSGNNHIKITGSSQATDGLGHILDIAQGVNDNIRFENTSAQDYQVALKYNLKPWEGGAGEPDGIAVNPDTGDPEYLRWEETYGELGEPDSVVDLGTTLKFVIDGVCEAGHSHQDRTAVVWMKDPASGALTQAIAIETLTVQWDGSNNVITTAAHLGQSTASTTASDYQVLLLGPTVRKGGTLATTNGYFFIGVVTGAGAGTPPSVFDHAQQTIHSTTLANISDITRIEPSNSRLKIQVTPGTGESSIDQIRSLDELGNIRFAVDEVGNVTIKDASLVTKFSIDSVTGDVNILGDLDVAGTTTQHDVVQTISSSTITQNLTAGDADGDDHTIKGTWTHKSGDNATTFFHIDSSADGHIGVGTTASGTYLMDIAGSLHANSGVISNNLDVDGALDVDLDSIFNAALTVSGAFNPQGDIFADLVPESTGAYDLGSTGKRWRDLFLTNQATMAKLSTGTGVGEGVVSHLYPSTDGTLNLGSFARKWNEIQGVALRANHTTAAALSANLAHDSATALAAASFSMINNAAAVGGGQAIHATASNYGTTGTLAEMSTYHGELYHQSDQVITEASVYKARAFWPGGTHGVIADLAYYRAVSGTPLAPYSANAYAFKVDDISDMVTGTAYALYSTSAAVKSFHVGEFLFGNTLADPLFHIKKEASTDTVEIDFRYFFNSAEHGTTMQGAALNALRCSTANGAAQDFNRVISGYELYYDVDVPGSVEVSIGLASTSDNDGAYAYSASTFVDATNAGSYLANSGATTGWKYVFVRSVNTTPVVKFSDYEPTLKGHLHASEDPSGALDASDWCYIGSFYYHTTYGVAPFVRVGERVYVNFEHSPTAYAIDTGTGSGATDVDITFGTGAGLNFPKTAIGAIVSILQATSISNADSRVILQHGDATMFWHAGQGFCLGASGASEDGPFDWVWEYQGTNVVRMSYEKSAVTGTRTVTIKPRGYIEKISPRRHYDQAL